MFIQKENNLNTTFSPNFHILQLNGFEFHWQIFVMSVSRWLPMQNLSTNLRELSLNGYKSYGNPIILSPTY